MMNRFNRQSAGGFTLTEVILVVLVLAIIGALVAPMMTEDASTKLRSAASLLAADLDYARIESISHGDDLCVVVFDTTDHGYHLARASATSTPIDNPADRNNYATYFGAARARALSGVTISAVSVGGDDELGFGLYGQLDQANDATITLACDGLSITLTIDAVSGEVTIGSIS